MADARRKQITATGKLRPEPSLGRVGVFELKYSHRSAQGRNAGISF